MKNKYDALCRCCFRMVAAGCGLQERNSSGKWLVFHKECYSDGKGKTHPDEFEGKEWNSNFTQGY